MRNLKLNIYPGYNVANSCSEILVDDESVESAEAFNPKQLGYITSIFEDTPDTIFYLLLIHRYNEVAMFIKELLVCGKYAIQPKDTIT